MDIKDVENLAALARIELSNDEKQGLLAQMQGILEYVKQVEKADVKTEEKHTAYNVWRDDAADSREYSTDLITGQFPDSKDGFLKVKKIL